MAVAVMMVTVVVILVAAALAAGHFLTDRIDGLGRADRNRWKPVTRGRVAARGRRREAALVAGLNRRSMSRADYHDAMSQLAAADEVRCPVHVPRSEKR
ncbi:hypothetical protein [Virgisporangium aurantiacum]|uniref:Uncharacterized protein n=1 Tax=Virgisporangium aurantiacum TaxID=175570 RepID=A0A8J4E062_9ACTN|nr:hypothetical protein [Virgisporangium aurantiacum]GIJ54702.1 hypothetical protein Vau01_022180 [Virgisporangium aurantiacum]